MITFRTSFQGKYKCKKAKKLKSIINSKQWQIVDIRAKEEWQESHILNSINVPHHLFKLIFFRYLKKSKRILMVSQAGHSHLNLYRKLKKYRFKVYLLFDGWKALKSDSRFDQFVTYNPIDW